MSQRVSSSPMMDCSSDQNQQHIQCISYSKLQEYDQTRTDLSIRKYVLITNLLRDPVSTTTTPNTATETASEQHWFDACLDELDKEEQQEEQEQQQEAMFFERQKFYCPSTIQLHTFYDTLNGAGLLVCTSSSSPSDTHLHTTHLHT